jgi:L-ascorbate metabolism protein UlaG (beta-lactamase superfamily)
MDIEWLGWGCFRLKGGGLTVLTDPFDDRGGIRPDVPEVDIVTLSRPPTGADDALRARRKVLRSPGDYEIAGAFISGIRTYRDGKRGPNTAYRLRLDGVRLCHLGALGHVPTADQASAIGDADILLMPVGGETLTPAQAAETTNLLGPKVIIPMPWKKAPGERTEPLQAFLKELGLAAPALVARWTVTPSTLPGGKSASSMQA